MSADVCEFEKRYEADPNSGCWLWIGSVNPEGYGRFQHNRKAHRAAWEIYVGTIPDRLCVLHKCDVRCCVNPKHLFLGTYADNNADRSRKGRSAKNHPRLVRSFGEIHNRAKLTNAQVEEIRASSRPTKALAEIYDVSRTHIQRIKSGECRSNDRLGKINILIGQPK